MALHAAAAHSVPARRTIARLMLGVAAAGVALGLLRTSEGPAFALGAGCLVGCYLAPFLAHRGMRRLDVELAALPQTDPRAQSRPLLLAQAYVMILFGWIVAGVAIAAAGLAVARQLRGT